MWGSREWSGLEGGVSRCQRRPVAKILAASFLNLQLKEDKFNDFTENTGKKTFIPSVYFLLVVVALFCIAFVCGNILDINSIALPMNCFWAYTIALARTITILTGTCVLNKVFVHGIG